MSQSCFGNDKFQLSRKYFRFSHRNHSILMIQLKDILPVVVRKEMTDCYKNVNFELTAMHTWLQK